MATTIKGLKDKDGLKCEIGKDYVVGLNDALAEKAPINNPEFTGKLSAPILETSNGLVVSTSDDGLALYSSDDSTTASINIEPSEISLDGEELSVNINGDLNVHGSSHHFSGISENETGSLSIGTRYQPRGGAVRYYNVDVTVYGTIKGTAVEDTPTEDSDKLITSGGMYTALAGKANADLSTSHNVDFDSTSEDFGVDGLDSETTFGTKIIKIGYTKRVGTPLVSYNFTDYAKLIIAKRTANTQVGSQLLIQKVIIEQEDSIKIFSRTRAFPINPQLPWDSWTLKSITLS